MPSIMASIHSPVAMEIIFSLSRSTSRRHMVAYTKDLLSLPVAGQMC